MLFWNSESLSYMEGMADGLIYSWELLYANVKETSKMRNIIFKLKKGNVK